MWNTAQKSGFTDTLMAYEKVDKEFVMSDSSVNVYGFKLLTKGWQQAEFKKNPIGYYGHDKKDGVLLKWEDIRLDGDQIIGKPVINLEHPRAKRTISEINDGFVNAASIGKVCVLASDVEDNPNDPKKPILVVTEWFNGECSLVDNPGNRDAMKVELCDKDDKVLDLSDLIEISRRDKQQNSFNQNSNMKKITLSITPALIALLNLSDDADEASINKGIQDLADTNKDLLTQIATQKKDASKKEIDGMLEAALAGKKITVELKTQLSADYADNAKGLKKVLDGLGVYIPLAEQISKAGEEKAKKFHDLSWDEIMEKNLMNELKSDMPDLYKQIYKKTFGKEPA